MWNKVPLHKLQPFFFFLIFLAMNEWHLVIRIGREGKKQDSFLFILFCFENKLILCYWYFLIFFFFFFTENAEILFQLVLGGVQKETKMRVNQKMSCVGKEEHGWCARLTEAPTGRHTGPGCMSCFPEFWPRVLQPARLYIFIPVSQSWNQLVCCA